MTLVDLPSLAIPAGDGAFTKHQIPSLLASLARSRHSGQLTLVSGAAKLVVGYNAGQVVSVISGSVSERLTSWLMQKNILTKADIVAAEKLVAEKQLQFGAALVELGKIKAPDLARYVAEHRAWLLPKCLAWEKVDVVFDQSGKTVRGTPLPLLKCVETGVRAYAPEILEELTADLGSAQFLIEQSSRDQAREFGASESLLQVLSAVSLGSKTIHDLIGCSEDDEPAVPALVLILTGFVTPVAVKAARPAPVAKTSGEAKKSRGAETAKAPSPLPAESSASGRVKIAPSSVHTPEKTREVDMQAAMAKSAASKPAKGEFEAATVLHSVPEKLIESTRAPAFDASTRMLSVKEISEKLKDDQAAAEKDESAARAVFERKPAFDVGFDIPAPSSPLTEQSFNAEPAAKAHALARGGAGAVSAFSSSARDPTTESAAVGPRPVPDEVDESPLKRVIVWGVVVVVILAAGGVGVWLGTRTKKISAPVATVPVPGPAPSNSAAPEKAVEPVPVPAAPDPAPAKPGPAPVAAVPAPVVAPTPAPVAAPPAPVPTPVPPAPVVAVPEAREEAASKSGRGGNRRRKAEEEGAAAKTTPERPIPVSPAKPEPKVEATPAPKNDAAPAQDQGGVAFKLGIVKQLLQQKQYRQAVEACLDILKSDPRNAMAYRSLGIAYSGLGAKTEACQSYQRYLMFAPNAPDKDRVMQVISSCN